MSMPLAVLTRQLLVLEHDVLKAIATGGSLAAAMDMLCRQGRGTGPGGDLLRAARRSEKGACVRWRRRRFPPSTPPRSTACRSVPRLVPAAPRPIVGRRWTSRTSQPIPLWDDYRHLVLPLGLRACWSSPILSRDGTPIGTFAFYYRTRDGSRELERLIVDACVPLCAIAIEHERAHVEVHRLAYHDALTQLANRTAFFERAKRRDREVRRGQRHRRVLSRPRWLQGDQRQVRPLGRRPTAR